MRLLHLVDSLAIGGSESLAASLARGLADSGVASVICGLGEGGALESRLERDAVPFLTLGATDGVQPRAMWKLADLLVRKRCDVVISHHFRQLLHVAPAAFMLRRPVIHVEHDFHSYLDRPDIVKKMGYCLAAVQTFVGVSNEITSWFEKRIVGSEGKFRTIVNGVDVERFRRSESVRRRLRGSLHIAGDAIVVGTCARLEAVKDLTLLIRSFRSMLALLEKTAPWLASTACLVMVGDGEEREKLQAVAEKSGLCGRCFLPGMVDNVDEWLSAFDIYAITSRDEGLPLSVMEAMSSSLPVVGVDVGSVSRLVNDHVGQLLAGRSPDEIGQVLAEFAGDYARRHGCGKAARQYIKKSYSMRATVAAYLDLLPGC